MLTITCTAFGEVIIPNVVGDPYEEEREYLTIEGFKVYVLPVQQGDYRGLSLEELEDERLRAIRKITTQIKLAVSVLPPDPINELRTRVVFHMEDTCEWGDEHRTGKKVRAGKVYYSPLASKEGTNLKLGQISIRCYSIWVHEFPHKGIVLHELAHAWHDLFIPDGLDNKKIKDQYEWSKECLHTLHKSYWKSNEVEFFAEMTGTYFFRSIDVPRTDVSMSQSNKTLIHAAWQDPPLLQDFTPSSGSCPHETQETLNPEARSSNGTSQD